MPLWFIPPRLCWIYLNYRSVCDHPIVLTICSVLLIIESRLYSRLDSNYVCSPRYYVDDEHGKNMEKIWSYRQKQRTPAKCIIKLNSLASAFCLTVLRSFPFLYYKSCSLYQDICNIKNQNMLSSYCCCYCWCSPVSRPCSIYW